MPAKEILLYGDIYGYSAERAITELNTVGNSDVVLRFNGDGGELRYGWGIITKAKELKGNKLFKNDGEANSLMAFAFCYNDNNEAIDTATFGFHRASYGKAYESSEFFTPADRQELVEKNAKLRAAMEAKIDVSAFQRVTHGITLDQLFSMDDRIEVCLTAKDALECKLINRIVKITPEYDNQVRTLAAHFGKRMPIAAHTEPSSTNPTPTAMTEEQLKSQHPEIYASIFNKGVTAEFDRAGSILAYIDADRKGAIEAFKSKAPLTETQRSEFAIKLASAKSVNEIEEESAPPITTKKEQPKTDGKSADEAKAKAEFDKAMDEKFYEMYPNAKRKTVTA